MSTNHPVQPLIKGRFKPNKIVVHLLDHGPFDMNRLAMLEFTDEDRQQFAQLIGYSLGGYSELNYVTDEAFDRLVVGDPDPADDPRRIAACLKVCEGISTEVLELNATAGGVANLERQRNAAIAALRAIKQEVFYGIKPGASDRIDAIITPVIAEFKERMQVSP
jgi:hypothetical protein